MFHSKVYVQYIFIRIKHYKHFPQKDATCFHGVCLQPSEIVLKGLTTIPNRANSHCRTSSDTNGRTFKILTLVDGA